MQVGYLVTCFCFRVLSWAIFAKDNVREELTFNYIGFYPACTKLQKQNGTHKVGLVEFRQ